MPTHENTSKSYDTNANQYHNHVTDPSDSPYHAFYEKPAIRAELPPLKGLEVISIGCGSGVDTRWLADNGAERVVGVDLSSELLKIARTNNPDIEFHEMDMEKLDLPESGFDLAYSSLAIHYVNNWTQSLREVHRILRDGGQYVFSCDHPIGSAMEYDADDNYRYSKLGRKVNKKTDERTIYGDYLASETDGVEPIVGALGDMDIVFYRRTFSKMVEQILASGLTINKVVEPQPIEGDPKHYEQLTKIPTFMIWVLQK